MLEHLSLKELYLALISGLVGFFIWSVKKLGLKVDDTYRKAEVHQMIDLKLSSIHSELQALRSSDNRLEAQINRLEIKIDKLLERESH